MKRITLDSVLREKLDNLVEDAELCDEQGHVVARVQRSTPWNDPENWERLTPDLSEDEWQRICETGDYGATTQELIDHLKGRG
jgi:hypothetical protein